MVVSEWKGDSGLEGPRPLSCGAQSALLPLHPRCATPRCRAVPCRSHGTRATLCDSALSGCALSELLHARCCCYLPPRCASALRGRESAGEKVLAGKCWRESAGVRADRVLASAPTEPLLGSTGQMSTAPSRRRRTASGARRTASDARPRRHGPGEHGATRATLNTPPRSCGIARARRGVDTVETSVEKGSSELCKARAWEWLRTNVCGHQQSGEPL